MQRFVVTYSLPYQHVVQVGISAEDAEAAEAQAEAAFDAGTLWDDTPSMPLLYDDYQEEGCSGQALAFEAVVTAEPYRVDASVYCLRQHAQAVKACRSIAKLIQRVRATPGAVDDNDLADVLREAVRAVELDRFDPAEGQPRLFA